MKILQIIPAEGWSAIYADGDGEIFVMPLVCWALVESANVDGEEIIGMTADDSHITDASDDNLLGYAKVVDLEKWRRRSELYDKHSSGAC
jgi:hypothetical protein